MAKKTKKSPTYRLLIQPVYDALLKLGGSGTNEEIYNQVVSDLKLPDDVLDESHLGSENQTELAYQLAWARTYLKNYGIVENAGRSVWAVTTKYTTRVELDPKEVIAFTSKRNNKNENVSEDVLPEETINIEEQSDFPEEVRPWRVKLSEVLTNMDPYGFERLTQRLLRACGFSQVSVTKKSGDGGIDGKGKLKINGIFSFNVAFQCKRYKGAVGAADIRDFRGSLTTDIEKGIFITTGTFTKAARDEASNPGKQQIDLIDGEEFINKIVEYKIGVKEVIIYEIDEEFFSNI